MSWEGEQPHPGSEEPQHEEEPQQTGDHEGVPTPDAVVEEWERVVSEAMSTVRKALEAAHEGIRSLSDERAALRARLERIAAALHDDGGA